MSAQQLNLGDFDTKPEGPDLSVLTETEREVYEAVELGDTGVREYQRERGWSSPGTISNHLRSAREKIQGGDSDE